jgi:ankyrin repeat protein
MELLIKKGADVKNFGPPNEHYPLQSVVFKTDNYGLAELLLKNDADPNQKGPMGITALYSAAGVGRSARIVQLLLTHKAGPSIQAINGTSPLHFVVMSNNKEWYDTHQKLNKQVIQRYSDQEEESSDQSFGKQRRKIAEILLKHTPTLVNMLDNDGKSPLHYAILHFGNPKTGNSLIELLIQNGANPYQKDNKNQSPWDLANPTIQAVIETSIKAVNDSKAKPDASAVEIINPALAAQVLHFSNTSALPCAKDPMQQAKLTQQKP